MIDDHVRLVREYDDHHRVPGRRAPVGAIYTRVLQETLRSRTLAEWVERFQAERMLCDRVNTPLDWLADPHVHAANAVMPLEQPGLGTLPLPALPGIGPWSVPAPALGAHTAEVLAELGL